MTTPPYGGKKSLYIYAEEYMCERILFIETCFYPENYANDDEIWITFLLFFWLLHILFKINFNNLS